MKHLSVAGAIRAANPVDPARAAEPLDAQARALLASHVHPSLLVSDDARPVGAGRPGRRGARLALVGALAAAAAVVAVVLVPGHEPPAAAGTTTGRVLDVVHRPAGEAGADWAASVITELTSPDGDQRLLRVWSKRGDVEAAEGALLVYSPDDETGWLKLEGEDSSLAILPTPSLDGFTVEFESGDGAGAAGVAVGSAAGGGDQGEDGGGLASAVFVFSFGPGESGGRGVVEASAFGPVSVDGVELWVSAVRRSDDTFFYVQALGEDLAKARSVLESLDLAPDGAWSGGALSELPSAAGAEALLDESELEILPPEAEAGLSAVEESHVSRVEGDG
ncbi:MAG: hypothetical protein LBD77_00930 [Bifidobacteriaceae bacterium]|jgi:hypothetical protein|nr:hypothetical protein [Bifidobacteriaceae bacterium]